MGFFLRHRLVIDATRNDEELALFECDHSVPQMNAQLAREDEKELVLTLVVMPDKLTFEFRELDVLAIELTYDAGTPGLGELPKLVGKVHLLVLALSHGRRRMGRASAATGRADLQRQAAESRRQKATQFRNARLSVVS